MRGTTRSHARATRLGATLATIAVLAGAATACTRDYHFGGEEAGDVRGAAAIVGGDPDRGRNDIRRFGCGSCHTIPGVTGANSLVGPPLTGIAERVYIAGVLPNNGDNMIRWLMDPQKVDSLTAMPKLGVGEAEARDIAAYLYTLR